MLLLQCTNGLCSFLGKSPWKTKFSTTTFNFSLTLIFCITLVTQKTWLKYSQNLNFPDFWAAVICCAWFSLPYFPLTELLGIKAVPASRGMKGSVPRQTTTRIEAFQCLIFLKTWLILCFHSLPLHSNKTRPLTKSSWRHFFFIFWRYVMLSYLLYSTFACLPNFCLVHLLVWITDLRVDMNLGEISLIASKFPRVLHRTAG